ncbi:YqzL family protein [Alicyclobacillus tolerans]|nr:YqzL family protein [Alicyclobacillus tolerans]MCF8563342.1 YqzL family protein [Alicyclobacillus tolerans]
MRDFSWRYFTLTGDIDAYLLYKEHESVQSDDVDETPETDNPGVSPNQ